MSELPLVSPHSLEAERAVLGAILVRTAALDEMAPIAGAADFFRDAHRRIFNTMVALRARGDAIDLVTLKEELQRAGELDEVGGPAYIASLADGVPQTANVEHYARIVKLHARARTLIAYSTQAIETFSVNPAAIANGSGTRFADAVRREIDAAHAGSGVVSPLVDDVAALTLPEPACVVARRILAAALLCLFGQPGIGKSFVAIDLALSVATGLSWLEADVVTRGPVVYVVAEGAAGIAPRIGAWKLARGISLDEPTGLHLWSGAVPLIDAARVSAFIGAVKPLEPHLVVLDTLARCLVGADENSARDMGIAIDAADRIRTQLGAAVLLVHHANKGNGAERGSSALRGACDTMLELAQADDLLTLSCSKQKDLEPFPAIALRLVPPYDGGRSCIVRPAQAVLSRPDVPCEDLTDAQSKALHALRESFGDSGATGDEWQAALTSMPRATFYRARKVLIDAGYAREVNRRFHVTGKRPTPRRGRETEPLQSHANLTDESHEKPVSHA